MNRVVGIVAAVALVMHFTMGCCAHSCHFNGHACPQVVQSSQSVSTRCCHRGHRHRAHAQRPASAANDQGIKVASSPCQHSCEHCSCTVTLNEKVRLPAEGLVATLVVRDDPGRLGLIATERNTSQVSIVLPGQHLHALCERFLI